MIATPAFDDIAFEESAMVILRYTSQEQSLNIKYEAIVIPVHVFIDNDF
jgi:hypothetical protein